MSSIVHADTSVVGNTPLPPGAIRPRRLRRTKTLRALVCETMLPPSRLVLPVFLEEGKGSVAGPIGTVAGAVVGAVAGGLIGKGVAESVNPSVEHDYWRQNYTKRPYVKPGTTYDEYAPAYQYGWESRQANADKDFDDVEADLRRDWDRRRGQCKLDWETAKGASRDAWERTASGRTGSKAD